MGGCLLLAGFEVPELIPVPRLRPGIVGLALALLTGVGVAAGAIPAWRASRVDPAEILRMD